MLDSKINRIKYTGSTDNVLHQNVASFPLAGMKQMQNLPKSFQLANGNAMVIYKNKNETHKIQQKTKTKCQ